MRRYRIPFNQPALAGSETDYLLEAVRNLHISGDGTFTKRCHDVLERVLQAPKVLLTTSCTHALEMAALLLDVEPGDEVIIPSFTFVSTANAFVLRGARPIFVDIRADTLNLDETRLDAVMSTRTRAIVVVHYAGVACEMDPILELARGRNVPVVEDNAHGLFGRYRGRNLGTLGCLAMQSFHETKNITCGEGGALVINDPRFVERAEIIREKGTNRSRFFRGQVDKYSWVDLGSSYLPSDLLAAFLLAQLEARDRIQASRCRIWEYYDRHLRPWAASHGMQVPTVPAHCEQPYHLYYLIVRTRDERQRLMAYLDERGILAPFHYVPLHLSEMARRFGVRPDTCPVAESVSERLLRLPFYNELREPQQAEVIDAIIEFFH